MKDNDQAQPAPNSTPPEQTPPAPKRGLPDGAPNSWDAIPDFDACPDISKAGHQ